MCSHKQDLNHRNLSAKKRAFRWGKCCRFGWGMSGCRTFAITRSSDAHIISVLYKQSGRTYQFRIFAWAIQPRRYNTMHDTSMEYIWQHYGISVYQFIVSFYVFSFILRVYYKAFTHNTGSRRIHGLCGDGLWERKWHTQCKKGFDRLAVCKVKGNHFSLNICLCGHG